MTISEDQRREMLSRLPTDGGARLWVPVDDEGHVIDIEKIRRTTPDYQPAGWKASRVGFVSALEGAFHFITLRDTEEALLYDDRGLYNGGANSFIKEWIEARFREKDQTASKMFCSETTESVRRLTFRERDSVNPIGKLCLWNGVLDLTGERARKVDHDPQVPFVTRLPVVYDPAQDCPRVRAFLKEVLPDERWRLVIQEMFGYCLKPGNPFKTAFFLVGPPDCGKSTLLEVLRGLLGPENTATIALQALADNRFSAAGLFGTLANIYTDLSPKLIKDAGLFKMLTGGSDRVPAEKKFQQPFSFVNPAKLIFSANTMPAVPWGDEAFFRRWAVVEFEVRIPFDDQVPFFESVLLEERSGILNWALEGLMRLERRGHFDTEGVLGNTRSRWRRLSDSLAWFAEEGVVRDRSAWVPKSDFYAAYTEFCEDRGVEALGQTDVGKELPQLIPGVRPGFPKVGGKGGKTVRAWMGLRLREKAEVVTQSRLDPDGSTGSTGSTPPSGMTHARAQEHSTIPEPPVEQVEPVEHDPEDLFKGGATRTDKARQAVGPMVEPAPLSPNDAPPSTPPPMTPTTPLPEPRSGTGDTDPRKVHRNCPFCQSITSHVCYACPSCVWEENPGGGAPGACSPTSEKGPEPETVAAAERAVLDAVGRTGDLPFDWERMRGWLERDGHDARALSAAFGGVAGSGRIRRLPDGQWQAKEG